MFRGVKRDKLEIREEGGKTGHGICAPAGEARGAAWPGKSGPGLRGRQGTRISAQEQGLRVPGSWLRGESGPREEPGLFISPRSLPSAVRLW